MWTGIGDGRSLADRCSTAPVVWPLAEESLHTPTSRSTHHDMAAFSFRQSNRREGFVLENNNQTMANHLLSARGFTPGVFARVWWKRTRKSGKASHKDTVCVRARSACNQIYCPCCRWLPRPKPIFQHRCVAGHSSHPENIFIQSCAAYHSQRSHYLDHLPNVARAPQNTLPAGNFRNGREGFLFFPSLCVQI